MAGSDVRFDVVATDKASKILDGVADKAEHVEDLDPTVTVKADATGADHTLTGLDDQLAKLTTADQIVVVSLRAGAAQSELSDLATKLATVDQADPDVAVTFDRYNEVSGQLDDLKTKLQSIADADPDAGKNLERARDRLGEIEGASGKAGGAIHSMAGNAVGDLAATAAGVGPLGEALGQITEGALSGEIAMKDLGKAALGIGAITLAILAVNSVLGHFQDEAKQAAEIKAFNVSNAKEYAEAVGAGNDAVTAYVDNARKLEQVKVAPSAADWTDALEALDVLTGSQSEAAGKMNDAGIKMRTSIQDVSGALLDAKLSARDFYAASIDQSTLDSFQAKLAAANIPLKEQAELLAAAYYQHGQYVAGAKDATDQAALYGAALDTTKASMSGYAQAAIHADDVTADQNLTMATAKKRLEDAKWATDNLTAAYAGLSAQISGDQSLIQLQDQLADTQAAGKLAWDAQVEANEAYKTGAKDAYDKQKAAEQAARDYQSQVNSLKQEIIHLGETAKMTPVEVQAELDRIDQGDLAGVAADAERYYRANPVDVHARLVGDLTGATARDFHGVGDTNSVTGTSATTSSVVNNYLARPAAAVETRRTAGRHARINGR